MIDAYTAAYATVSYTTQTTSFSLSVDQNKSDKVEDGPTAASNDDFNFSLGYTSTTTVETYSLLVIQESRDFNDSSDKQEKSALQTVLEGPKDPFDPIEGALAEFFSDEQGDGDDKSEKGHGNKYGHEVRDNNHGHTKNDIQASYSVAQYEVSTATFELSLTA